ncbi:MAG: M14-type cytosolic carboxypeptidase [Ignavibacteriaceae bacterium]|nr:M14-type cytosolic carboxypeptidase [Ignavibacteriaceae bacterium]
MKIEKPLLSFHVKIIFVLVLFITASSYPQITFDANFESGNLKSVTILDSTNYLVTTNEDIGGRWFYFRINGVQNKFIKVTVSNSDVKRAVYSYDNKSFTRFSASESPATKTFQKTYEQDTVYVAYYIPYTLSFLRERIKQWSVSPYVKVDTLGYTLRSLPIHELTITDQAIPDSLKYHVWVHARTHPSETPSSWQFDGFIESIREIMS